MLRTAAKVDYTLFRPGCHLLFPTKSRLGFVKSWHVPGREVTDIGLQKSNRSRPATTEHQQHHAEMSAAERTAARSSQFQLGSSEHGLSLETQRFAEDSSNDGLTQMLLDSIGGEIRKRIMLLSGKEYSSQSQKRMSCSDHVGIVTDFCLSPDQNKLNVSDRTNVQHLHAVDDGLSETELVPRVVSAGYSQFVPFPCTPFSNQEAPTQRMRSPEAMARLRSAIDSGLEGCNKRRDFYLFQAGLSAFSTVIATRMLSSVRERTADTSPTHSAAKRKTGASRVSKNLLSSIPIFNDVSSASSPTSGPRLAGKGPRLAFRLGSACVTFGACLTLGFSGLAAYTYR